MKLLIKNLFLVTILYVIIFYPMQVIYTKHYTQHPLENKSNWIFGLKNKTLDYAVIGSSDADRGIDINTIDSIYGVNGINLAQDGVCLEENFTMFKKFVNNNNKIKVLLISLFGNDFDSKWEFEIHYEKYIPYLNDTLIDAMLKLKTPPLKYWMLKLIPFSGYAEYNTFFTLKSVIRPKTSAKYFNDCNLAKGTELLYEKQNLYKWEDTKYDIKRDGALDKFISYAKSKKIKIVFLVTPKYSVAMRHILNWKDVNDSIAKLALNNHIRYFNYTSDTFSICKDSVQFRDASHLNAAGAIAFSKILAADIIDIVKK
jgi:hypothetical protein